MSAKGTDVAIYLLYDSRCKAFRRVNLSDLIYKYLFRYLFVTLTPGFTAVKGRFR